MKISRLLLFAIVGVALAATASAGTIISVTTPVGAITLELEDDAKPITVTNFLRYLNDGRYQNLFSHRLDDGFVLQSGGFTLAGNMINAVPTYAPIANEFTTEPRFSNTKGTIAMAKIGNDPDSATSQWFINLADNLPLDATNGGFTVFGRVIDGFDTLEKFNTDFTNRSTGGQGIYDKRAALNNGAFGELPLLEQTLAANNLIFTTIAVVPEPAALALILLGLALFSANRIARHSPINDSIRIVANSCVASSSSPNFRFSPLRFFRSISARTSATSSSIRTRSSVGN